MGLLTLLMLLGWSLATSCRRRPGLRRRVGVEEMVVGLRAGVVKGRGLRWVMLVLVLVLVVGIG